MARCWLRDMGRRWVAVEGNASADIVVVTHGGFLHFLTQDWEGMAANGGEYLPAYKDVELSLRFWKRTLCEWMTD